MDCRRPCAASSCAGLGFSYLRNQVATWREQDEHLVEWSPKKWFLGKTTVRLLRQFLALFCIFLHYLASNINDLRGGQKIRDAGSQVQILPLRPSNPPGLLPFFPSAFKVNHRNAPCRVVRQERVPTKAHFAGSASRQRRWTGQGRGLPTRKPATEENPAEGSSAGLMESISEADLPLRKGVVCPIPDIYGPLSKVV